jgi:hypothetical protein
MEIKEGRRCGLCGGGTDGRPPKVALHDTVDSDNEAYEGALPSEDPNYDMWDGFGDDPGWLGRLLGPIHDQFGIARVWVHQNCAVWSPEVCLTLFYKILTLILFLYLLPYTGSLSPCDFHDHILSKQYAPNTCFGIIIGYSGLWKQAKQAKCVASKTN